MVGLLGENRNILHKSNFVGGNGINIPPISVGCGDTKFPLYNIGEILCGVTKFPLCNIEEILCGDTKFPPCNIGKILCGDIKFPLSYA